jgi:hypothetical protein
MWWCRGWMGQEGVACWHVIRDPSRSASGTFHVLVGVQGCVPKAVLWWSCTMVEVSMYIIICFLRARSRMRGRYLRSQLVQMTNIGVYNNSVGLQTLK